MRVLFLIICIFIPACAHSVDDPIEAENKVSSLQRDPPVEESLPIRSKDPDACVPQRFAADDIPSNFRLDPSCPPNIYAPPRWLPPWDPSPVIK